MSPIVECAYGQVVAERQLVDAQHRLGMYGLVVVALAALFHHRLALVFEVLLRDRQ